MKTLNSYNNTYNITYKGFFKNVDADLEEEVFENLLLFMNDPQLRFNLTVYSSRTRAPRSLPASMDMIKKYLCIDKSTHKITIQNCDHVKIGMTITEKNCDKIHPGLYFDSSDNITADLYIYKISSSSKLSTVKGHFPKKINTLKLEKCTIDSWDWLDGVETTGMLISTELSLPNGFKGYSPICNEVYVELTKFGNNTISGFPSFEKGKANMIHITGCDDLKDTSDIFSKTKSIDSLYIFNIKSNKKAIESVGDMSGCEISRMTVDYNTFIVIVNNGIVPKKLDYLSILKYPRGIKADEYIRKFEELCEKYKINTQIIKRK